MVRALARSTDSDPDDMAALREATLAGVGVGLPVAPTVNVRCTPAVVATGPGFALKAGATSAVKVVTFATEEFALAPPELVARTRK